MGKDLDALRVIAKHQLLGTSQDQIRYIPSTPQRIPLQQCIADAKAARDQRLALSERDHTSCVDLVGIAATSGAIACASASGPLLAACLVAVEGGFLAGVNQCNINRDNRNFEIQQTYKSDVDTCNKTALVKPINVDGSFVSACSPSPWTEHQLTWQNGNQAFVSQYTVWGKPLIDGGREVYLGSIAGNLTSHPLWVTGATYAVRVGACDNEFCTNPSDSAYMASWRCNQ